jgi:hypothetical protein
MTGWPALVADLGAQTLRDPRAAVRRLIGFDPPVEARWLGLLLVTVLAVFVTRLSTLALPAGAEPDFVALVADPILGVPAQALSILLVAGAITAIGRVFGGQGRFADALLVVVWVQFLMALAQVAEFVVMLALPPLGAPVAIAALGLFLWVLAQAIAEIHGFQNLFKVFLGMVGGFVLVVTALAVILSALGILPAV